MDIIFSRKRIKLPQFRNGKKIILKKLLKTGSIVFCMIFVFSSILNAITPIFNDLCIDKAKSLATIISNEEATKVMKDYEYDELVSIHKDSEDNILMIEANIITINKIISDVAIKIQESINSNEENDISIKLGSFTGNKLIAGYGPDIPIKINVVGNVETDYRSEFTEAGINQTLHRIYLNVNCKVSILTPFETITEDINNQVVLAENVIIGKIPSTYYNLKGLQSGDLMEVIQ